MLKLKAFDIIKNTNRISSVDVFRSLAIIAVVIYHFNFSLPYGHLGVDLFFVVSGLLVGGLLTKEIENGIRINFLKFILQRGFKIWPSYYVFIFFGSLLAISFYHSSHPDQIIPFWDLKRYLLFYQNYTGAPYHWSFDHIWSLCVEEHFYIILPTLFLIVQYFVNVKHQKKALFIFVILTILFGIFFKYISYFYTSGKDTYSATHNRIDALAWGVLLNLLLTYCHQKIKSYSYLFLSFIIGLVMFLAAVYIHSTSTNPIFANICFHSVVPMSFFLMLLGVFFIDLSKLKVLRFIAYYSYNWYLWHPIFVLFITRQIGNNAFGLIVYLIITFLVAIIATVCIEEKFLKKRNLVLDKIFSKT